jgi:nitroreductase
VDFYRVITERRSVRKYSPVSVEEEKLNRILEAARIAPSAANRQPWHFIVVRDENKRKALKAAYDREWFYGAPAIICACGEPSKNWVRSDGKNYNDVDIAIAMDHLILAATAEGLGTCWIGAFAPAAVKKILELPNGIEPVAMTPLGYPGDAPGAKNRKSLPEIIHLNKW